MWNWPYLLKLFEYFDKIMHKHCYWRELDRGIAKSSPRDCKMAFNIGRGCAELQILKKWKRPNWVDYCDDILHPQLILIRCSPRDCQMSFWDWSRRCRVSNSEKQWNWLYLLKRFEYFDKIMHKHCHWRELDRGIAKGHLSSIEAMPRSKS